MALKSDTSGREGQRSTFARFFGSLDFRFLQQYLPEADIGPQLSGPYFSALAMSAKCAYLFARADQLREMLRSTADRRAEIVVAALHLLRRTRSRKPVRLSKSLPRLPRAGTHRLRASLLRAYRDCIEARALRFRTGSPLRHCEGTRCEGRALAPTNYDDDFNCLLEAPSPDR